MELDALSDLRLFDLMIASLANLPNWKWVKLEHAEHYVWITNRDAVLREMKSFLGM